MAGQEPDPLEVVLDPAVDDAFTDSGRYRGRRRLIGPGRRRPATPARRQTAPKPRPATSARRQAVTGRRWTSAWGIGAVLSAIGVLLVGSGMMARTLTAAQPDPSPPPSTATPAWEDRVVTGDRSGRDGVPTRSSPSTGPASPSAGPAAPPELPSPSDGADGSRQGPPAEPEPDEPSDPGPDAPRGDGCAVEVGVETNGDDYVAGFLITNRGEPWDGWTMTLTVPDGMRLDGGLSGRWSQQGNTMTVTNEPGDGRVGTGRTVSAGHRGEHQGEVSFTGFSVNGVTCTTP